jgi:hypothetical protein
MPTPDHAAIFKLTTMQNKSPQSKEAPMLLAVTSISKPAAQPLESLRWSEEFGQLELGSSSYLFKGELGDAPSAGPRTDERRYLGVQPELAINELATREQLEQKQARVEALIEQLLQEAEAADQAEEGQEETEALPAEFANEQKRRPYEDTQASLSISPL